jgi:hypothetical protein
LEGLGKTCDPSLVVDMKGLEGLLGLNRVLGIDPIQVDEL